MRISTCLHAGVVVTGIAVAGLPAVATASAIEPTQPPSPPSVTRDAGPVGEAVPPGGLLTSFLRNQVIYCSIICPLAVQTGVTAAVTVGQAPGTYLEAVRSNDPMRAIGITAASITGPTNAAAQPTIVADGTIVAPRALNAFETGVVGLLDVASAAADGPDAAAAALETAREDTYTALNRPIVPDPVPTVSPQGADQVAVVATIDVGAAVIFPAFNHMLSAVFEAPDAAARELAVSGDPERAVAAGADTVAAARTAAETVIADAMADADDRIRAATGSVSG